MTACELDGSVRVVIDRDRFGVTWRCPFCKGISREEFDPTPTNDLNREWERR